MLGIYPEHNRINIGYELELVADSPDSARFADGIAKEDCSISPRGWEFCSVPMRPTAAAVSLRRVFDSVAGLRATTNSTTGFHVHVSVPPGLDKQTFAGAAGYVGNLLWEKTPLPTISRRDGQTGYCRPQPTDHLARNLPNKWCGYHGELVADGKGASPNDAGTVEYRMFRASSNWRRLHGYVQIALAMHWVATEIYPTVKDVQTPKSSETPRPHCGSPTCRICRRFHEKLGSVIRRDAEIDVEGLVKIKDHFDTTILDRFFGLLDTEHFAEAKRLFDREGVSA